MDEPGFRLENAKITIIGLGLMGGSLALSLKGNCRVLTGLDTDPVVVALAERKGVVDRAGSDAREMLADVDVVILACPLPAILDWLACLPDFIQRECIVLDIGSSKRAVADAMARLPMNFDPVGGHAICGKETLSLENAEAHLYQDAPFVLTPLERTGRSAREAALQIISLLGARPLWADAEEHDRMLAATSHLPFLLASALSLAVPQEAAPFAGPGLRSSTRLAGTPASMMLGVLRSNRENVLAALDALRDQLDDMEEALRKDDAHELASILEKAQTCYKDLTDNETSLRFMREPLTRSVN